MPRPDAISASTAPGIATGCSTEDAARIAWQAHMMGKAMAYEGTFDECFRVQGVLREIQLVTEIEG